MNQQQCDRNACKSCPCYCKPPPLPPCPFLQARVKPGDDDEDTRCCGVTQGEREADAMQKVNNRIFFMGITKLGYQKPIREAINPGLRDKYEGRPSLEQFLPNPNAKDVDYARLAEKFHNIDVYTGLVDGKNYGRVSRLLRQKIKHARNPHGTEERFCVPMTHAMDYGWWIRDQKWLDESKWYAVAERFPTVRGEITKFVDEMGRNSPNFILF